MTHAHFYDLNGNPITGKSPVQIRVTGGKMLPATRAGVQAFLNVFLGKARISIAERHQQVATLADGTKIEASSIYGVVAVTVEVPPDPIKEDENLEGFFGGILIRPSYYPTESVVFGPGAPSLGAARTTVPEVTSRGKILGKPGRSAVPGTATGDITNWLVVQIVRNKPLTVTPVAKGYVKFFRIKDPLFGPHVEVNTSPVKYLLSANENLTEFYICGKRATHVPPLPLTGGEIAAIEQVRIRTINFVPKSFKLADKTHGIIIVAVNTKLFAINTKNRPPAGTATWQLLSTGAFASSPPRINTYGTTFTTTSAPSGALTVVCSGSNGAGVCSGFSVTVTPVVDNYPTLSGTASPMHDGTVEAIAQIRSYEASLDFAGTVVAEDTPSVTIGAGSGPLFAIWREHTCSYSVTRSVAAGANALVPDRFGGGTFPRYSAGARSDTVSITTAVEFDTWVLGAITGTPGAYAQNIAARFTVSDVYTASSTQAGDTSDLRASTTDYTRDSVEHVGDTDVGVDGSFAATYSRTVDTVVTDMPADPVLRFQYTAFDFHVGALAFQREAWRTATRTPFGDETGSPTAECLSIFRPFVAGTVSETISYSGLTLGRKLKRYTGALLLDEADSFVRFASRPTWADAQSTVTSGGEKYAMLSYRYGPDPLDSGDLTGTSPNVTASYVEWVPAVQLSLHALDLRSISGGSLLLASGAPLDPTGAIDPTVSAGPSSTPFSFSYTKDGTEPTSYPLSTFNTLVPQSYYAYGSLSAPSIPDIVVVDPPTGPTPPSQDTAGVANPLISPLTISDVLYHDLRTGGFITQSIWYHEHSTGVWRTSLETYIGNDTGMVPLRAVLDEWRALGELNAVTDDKQIFAVDLGATRVALL